MNQQKMVIILILSSVSLFNLFVTHKLVYTFLFTCTTFILYVLIKSVYDALTINECISENLKYMKMIKTARNE